MHIGQLLLREDPTQKNGLCSQLYFCCSTCKKGAPFRTSPSAAGAIRGKPYDVNRRSAVAAVEIGTGHQGLSDLCSIMNMPSPVSTSAYAQHSRKLSDLSDKMAKTEMKAAGNRLRKQLMEDDASITDTSIIDVCVTFDGTWSKRGYTANHGVGIVISVVTGEVLDCEALSKVCGECNRRNRRDKESVEYKLWYDNHRSNCKQNYTGSSSSMETAIAQIIWSRSLEIHNFRYMYMVCDGDSKSHNDVKNIYADEPGNDPQVEKRDCVGHIGKRMYRALDNFRTKTKGKLSDGKSVGGAKGRLTGGQNGAVGRLSDLYRKAIYENVDPNARSREEVSVGVATMHKAIQAVLHHSTKIVDDDVRHKYCPLDGFCQYKTTGSMENKDHHLDPIFLDLLRPIFDRLSESHLLERCIGGYSQNQNESFNSLIWKRCPKHTWRGPLLIKLAVNLSVLQWSCGAFIGRSKIMTGFRLDQGKYTCEASVVKDSQRLSHSLRKATELEKKIRVAEVKRKDKEERSKKKREGKTYETAAFACSLTPSSESEAETSDDSEDDEPLVFFQKLSTLKKT